MQIPFSIKNPGWLGSTGGPLVGDLAGGARGAWGVARKLIQDYSGPAFRGRNISSNAEADISYGSMFDEVYDLADGGQFVVVATTLYDNTGAGLHMTQPTASRQPLIFDPFTDDTALYGVNSPAYGYPVMLFDGADDSLRTPLDNTWTGFDTSFCTFAHWAHANGDKVYGSRSTTQLKVFQQVPPSPTVQMYMNAPLDHAGFSLNSLALHTGVWDDPVGSSVKNAGVPVTGGMSTATDCRGWVLGASWLDGFSHCACEVSELMVWNSILGSGDQTDVRAEIIGHFGF